MRYIVNFVMPLPKFPVLLPNRSVSESSFLLLYGARTFLFAIWFQGIPGSTFSHRLNELLLGKVNLH